MLAASYWSLLAPAIEIAQESELYGADGRWVFLPVSIGFALGAGAMLATESILRLMQSNSTNKHDMSKKCDDFPKNEKFDQKGTADVYNCDAGLILCTDRRRSECYGMLRRW